MGDRSKNFKFNSKKGGVDKLHEEMRKNLQNKRRQDRFNLSGDNRPTLDEWESVCFSLEYQALIIHSTDDIVNAVKNHPCLDDNATYPDGYIQNASVKLKDYIKSAIDLLQQQRAIFKNIQYRFPTCLLTADKLPILLNFKNDEAIETVMDTSEVNVSVASDENDIGNIADVFITQDTVLCALKIWAKLFKNIGLDDKGSSLFQLLTEFIAFISSLRPSYFNLTVSEEWPLTILQVIELSLSPDFNHINNLLFFLYNIFEAQSLSNFHSFLTHLIPAIQQKFRYLASTLSDTHSPDESTIKFLMGVSGIFKCTFEYIKTLEDEKPADIYQEFEHLLVDSAIVMAREYPFISLNFSSILADFSDSYVDILTQESVYNYIIRTFRDPSLLKNSLRMAINLANKLEINELEDFLIKSNFFVKFAESLKLCKHEANKASYTILEIMFRRLSLPFIAENFIDSGLFNQICEHYFWGSLQDKSNFRQIAPFILSWEPSSRYIGKLLDCDLLSAFFHDLYKTTDSEVFDALCCVEKLHEWSREADKLEDFKMKIVQIGVFPTLGHADITSRGNNELEKKRRAVLNKLHGEFSKKS